MRFVSGNHPICQCCYNQLGFDDYEGSPHESVNEAWQHLRTKWLDGAGWSPEALEQVKVNLGIGEQRLRREGGEV